MASARALFPSLPGIAEPALNKIVKLNFVYCQMTKHNDQEEGEKYYQIKFVEFLDFLGRVALDYFEELGHGPTDLED